MPERQSRHPDNELIEAASKPATPSHQGSGGGDLSREVGTRAELNNADGEEPGVERVTGKDNPDADAQKGSKSLSRMQGGG